MLFKGGSKARKRSNGISCKDIFRLGQARLCACSGFLVYRYYPIEDLQVLLHVEDIPYEWQAPVFETGWRVLGTPHGLIVTLQFYRFSSRKMGSFSGIPQSDSRNLGRLG